MISQQAGEIFGYLKIYGQQHVKLAKLDLSERVSKVTSVLTLILVLFILMLFVLFMLSIAVGLYLGNLWESYPRAFLVLTGVYVLAGVIVYAFRKPLIVNPILSMVINEMMDEDEE